MTRRLRPRASLVYSIDSESKPYGTSWGQDGVDSFDSAPLKSIHLLVVPAAFTMLNMSDVTHIALLSEGVSYGL